MSNTSDAVDLLTLIGAPPESTASSTHLGSHNEVRDVPDNIDLDMKAVRLLSGDVSDVCPIQLVNGRLWVAWANQPSPAQIQTISQMVGGMDIIVGVCATESALHALQQRAETLRGQQSDLTERLLDAAIKAQASDIHLSVGDQPKIRVGGRLRKMPGMLPISRADIDEVSKFLIPTERLGSFEQERDLDCAATYGGWRLRISLYYEMQSRALAIRIIPRDIMSVQELGLPESILNLTRHTHGLVLVCGATGSGKSTTLAAMVDHINSNIDCHILTVEDPVEYIHTDRTATIHQREVGIDTTSFARALRHALRQDPDVILVGEMRDLETVRTALEAAETGHLVLATLHVRDAASAPTRVIGMFPENEQEHVRQQLAESLLGVVVQRLLPSANSPTTRHVVCEVLLSNTAVRNLIRQNQLQQIPNLITTSRGEGMQGFDHDLARVVREGKVSREVALAACSNQDEFEQALAGRQAMSAGVGMPLS